MTPGVRALALALAVSGLAWLLGLSEDRTGAALTLALVLGVVGLSMGYGAAHRD